MSEEAVKGASGNERLIRAARDDNEDLLIEVFDEGDFNINYQDGLGNTALHYAAQHGNTDVLEHILTHEDCDVDPINRIERQTPLHLAVQIEQDDLRHFVVESLLDAGADTTIKNKDGQIPLDCLLKHDDAVLELFRKTQVAASISKDDIADDDDDEGEPGSGSGSESE